MFYPIMLDITNKKIVVVGGGKVGYRKVKKFLEFGGRVKVVSPKFFDKFQKLQEVYKERLLLVEDIYHKDYISHSLLVVAATSSEIINKQISKDCEDENILCNVVDSLEDSKFICPSIVNNSGLILSISTMGNCPFLSKKIRMDLERKYSDINEEYIILLGEVRNIIISKYSYKKEKLLDYCLKLNKEELNSFYQRLKGEKKA